MLTADFKQSALCLFHETLMVAFPYKHYNKTCVKGVAVHKHTSSGIDAEAITRLTT